MKFSELRGKKAADDGTSKIRGIVAFKRHIFKLL